MTFKNFTTEWEGYIEQFFFIIALSMYFSLIYIDSEGWKIFIWAVASLILFLLKWGRTMIDEDRAIKKEVDLLGLT